MADLHEQAERDYMLGMQYQKIADKYGVSINTVKSWKTRYKWARTKKKVCTQKKCAPKINPLVASVNESLTEKQQLFCQYYIKNFNATQAAIKAGYSKESAGVIGYENLTKPQIRAEVERLKAIKHQALFVTEDDIVERYMRIAFSDMTDFVEFGTELVPEYDPNGAWIIGPDGNPKYRKRAYVDFKDHDQVDGGLIREISMGRQGMKVKLEDRQKALDWLANYFNMNPMHKHKVAYDNAVLDLRKRELEAREW